MVKGEWGLPELRDVAGGRALALATDFDGTIAHDGRVAPQTVQALTALRASGRRVLVITGRSIEDLLPRLPGTEWLDLVIAENGAVLYEPTSQVVTTLASAPPSTLLPALCDSGIPAYQCRVMITMDAEYAPQVEGILDRHALPFQVILNKRSAMVLPAGVDKASGLEAGLRFLQLWSFPIAGIGDAENDGAFLQLCHPSAAVANALPELKAQVDLIMHSPNGGGVAEFIYEHILGNPSASRAGLGQ